MGGGVAARVMPACNAASNGIEKPRGVRVPTGFASGPLLQALTAELGGSAAR